MHLSILARTLRVRVLLLHHRQHRVLSNNVQAVRVKLFLGQILQVALQPIAMHVAEEAVNYEKN